MGQAVKKERLEDSQPQLPGQISIPRTASVAPFSTMQRLFANPTHSNSSPHYWVSHFWICMLPGLQNLLKFILASSSLRFVPDLVLDGT
jgi:hypothetical protein